MKPQGGIRSAFLTTGIEAAADTYLADCRQVLMTSDPAMTEVTHPQLIQAMMSVAVQRMLHWSSLHRGEDADADAIPTQAVVGAFTGVGISLAMFGYDPESVLRQCLPAMARAWLDACATVATEGSDAVRFN